MKILFADAAPAAQLAQLKQAGHVCTNLPDLTADALPGAIADHDILVVRSTRVTADTFAAARALKLVIRAGAGTNTIDKASAKSCGVAVSNVPGANAAAVAELCLGLMLCIDRRLPDMQADLRQGVWNKTKYSRARGLCGQTLGILGLGAVGLAVAERARAFGMHVLAEAKPNRSAAVLQRIAELDLQLVERAELLAKSDVVSLHQPYQPQAGAVADAAFLAQMQDGATLINTARGELIDEAALIDAMDRRGMRAGLDVYQNEPAAGDKTFDSPLAKHPSVIGSHHVGASTEQAQQAVADGVLAVIADWQRGAHRNPVS